MKKLFILCGIVGAAALITGCQIPNQSKAPRFEPRPNGLWSNELNTVTVKRSLDPTLLQPPQELFTLGPGDQIEVELMGKPSSRTLLTVGPDGRIYFDLLPGLDVWGLTMAQTKKALEEALDKFMSMPEVSVTLKAVGSKYVWMLGKVNRPGIYPTVSPMTLLEAMSAAGGTARSSSAVSTVDLADLRHAFVVRNGQSLPVDFQRLLEGGDMSQNIYLQPDDFVYVPSSAAREIYLFGAVRSPRAMPLSEQPTLVAAIAAGGGPLKDAFLSQVAIVRGSLTTPEIAVVDYNEIIKGRAPDVELQPRDIVFVPYSPYRVLTRYVDAILNTFMYTVAANAGSDLAGGDNVGVAVPVGK
jgi:protein involved in polysaccharide export with SLBB domain